MYQSLCKAIVFVVSHANISQKTFILYSLMSVTQLYGGITLMSLMFISYHCSCYLLHLHIQKSSPFIFEPRWHLFIVKVRDNIVSAIFYLLSCRILLMRWRTPHSWCWISSSSSYAPTSSSPRACAWLAPWEEWMSSQKPNGESSFSRLVIVWLK